MKRDLFIRWPVLVLVSIATLPSEGRATEIFVIGGSDSRTGLTWEEASGFVPLIDSSSRPGWILPRSVDESTNVALGTVERGGRITSPNAVAVLRQSKGVVQAALNSMMDGDPDTAFEMKNVLATGVLVIVDLGARFGVNHIRFFPRREFKDDFMKGYIFSLNDGLFGADIVEASVEKLPDKRLFIPVAEEISNKQDTIDVRFPLQYVRYFRLQSTQRFNWEIDEIEIFGRGFVPEARFLSQPLDLRQSALWGRLHWASEAVGHEERARITIRTRSGTSPSPEEQPESWSDWSAPYRVNGAQIVSPSSRRYLQFSVDFQSDGLEDGVAVDSLAFEFTRPALADVVTGRIFPRQVALGLNTPFTYSIEVVNARGFDQIEIDTPAPVRAVTALVINGQETAFTPETRDDGLTVSFAGFSGSGELQIFFDTSVLRYETVFSGRLRNSARDDLPQQVVGLPEDGEVRRNWLSVRVPLKGQDLVHRVDIAPNPFTPNGDGINDQVTISYDLLYLIAEVPVSLTIYDLAGNLVAVLPAGANLSGRHLVRWDGVTEEGETLPPGLYIVQVEASTDSGTQRRSGVVAIAY